MLSQYGRYNFKYDASGLRYSKTTNDSSTYYYYNGDRLIGEDCLYGRIRYMYDHKEIVGARFFPSNGDMVEYEYIKDATGSVIAILKDSTIVAQYTYDAWGNIINQTINYSDVFAQINPIRYKGYYFDRETGLYYLQSRYYNPEIGAFISPDSVYYLDPENIGGLNLYCYCNNNPVMYVDRSGHFAISALIIGALIGGVVSFGTSYAIDVAAEMQDGFDWSDFNTFEGNGWKYGLAFIGGAVSGAFGAVGGAGWTFVGEFAGNMIENAYTFTSGANVGHAIWTSLLSASIGGMFEIGANKITKSFFENSLSGLSKTAQKQVKKFIKNGTKITNKHAAKLINKTVGLHNVLTYAFKSLNKILTIGID